MSANYIASVDQGTSSSRCFIFDSSARVVSVGQKEHHNILPRPGWVEHDAREIWTNVLEVIGEALDSAQLEPSDLVALGITNQRETTVVWDRATGEPCTTRSPGRHADRPARRRARGGARPGPLQRAVRPPARAPTSRRPSCAGCSTRFRACASEPSAARCCSGPSTPGSIWNLTGRHVTDPTNACRTMLMNLRTLDWDDELLNAFGVPGRCCRRSARRRRSTGTPKRWAACRSRRRSAIRSAALFGQTCFSAGDAKCTYGTGSFC